MPSTDVENVKTYSVRLPGMIIPIKYKGCFLKLIFWSFVGLFGAFVSDFEENVIERIASNASVVSGSAGGALTLALVDPSNTTHNLELPKLLSVFSFILSCYSWFGIYTMLNHHPQAQANSNRLKNANLSVLIASQCAITISKGCLIAGLLIWALHEEKIMGITRHAI